MLTSRQYLYPKRILSAIAYRISRNDRPWLKSRLIRWFVRTYRVEMREALEPMIEAYPDFNTFFTRALHPGARPVAESRDAVCSPADGVIANLGRAEDGTLLQAKGQRYSLESLVAGDPALTHHLRNGRYATIYLSPRDYHRVHVPLAATVTRLIHVPGELFSVNPATTARIPRLFARNERVIFDLHGPLGRFALIMVAAVLVGGIETVWGGPVVSSGRGPRTQELASARGLDFAKGEEIARFNMGSTVILLLPPGAGEWRRDLAEGSTVKVGEEIARLRRAPPA